MSLKYYANDNHCDVKAISEFRAMEERFNSLEDCCRAKFPQNISDCCEAADNGCSLSGNHKFIPVSTSGICNSKIAIPDLMLATDFFQIWMDQICYTKDENLLADWEKAFAKDTLRECCNHNMHYNVELCCENSEGSCQETWY